MVSEPRYDIFVSGPAFDLMSEDIRDKTIWEFNAADDAYKVAGNSYLNWQFAMADAIRFGLGRKTSEADTYELLPGVQIKAVHDGR